MPFSFKRFAQSARPLKEEKGVKEVKTNKTKKLKKTLVQIWHKMVPTWYQNGPSMVPKWSQDAPRRPQKTTKNTKTKNVGPQEVPPRFRGHLLGPMLDPKLNHFGQNLETFCQHVCEEVSSSIFNGFWEASEPSFFDSRWSENTILTFLVRSLLASFSTPKTFPKSFKKWSQEGFKRLLKGYKKYSNK